MCNPQSGFLSNVLPVVEKEFDADLQSVYNQEFIPRDSTARPNPPMDYVRIQPNTTSYARSIQDGYRLTNDAGVALELDKEMLEKIKSSDPSLYNKMTNPEHFVTTNGEHYKYYPGLNMISNPQDQPNVRMEGSGFTLEQPLELVGSKDALSSATTNRDVYVDQRDSFTRTQPPTLAALDSAGRVTGYSRRAIVPEEWPNPEADYKASLEQPQHIHPSVVDVMQRHDQFLMEENPHAHKQR